MKQEEKIGGVMRDYAACDPRSVRAGLEGRDDGRVARYERYFAENLERASDGIEGLNATQPVDMTVNEVYQAGFRAAHLAVADDVVSPGAARPYSRLIRVSGLVLGMLVYEFFLR